MCLVTARIANKMADEGRFVAVTLILLSLLPVIAAYQCHGILLCYLLISRKRQQVTMLNAAMEYNKALARVRHVKRRIIRQRRFQRKPVHRLTSVYSDWRSASKSIPWKSQVDLYSRTNLSIPSTLSSDHTHFVFFFSLCFFWVNSESLDIFRFFPPDYFCPVQMFDLTRHHDLVWKNEIREDSPTLQSKYLRFLAKYISI